MLTNERGTTIERSQTRQPKLHDIVAWHFDHLVEASPLTFQPAPLILNCTPTTAYTITSGVLGATVASGDRLYQSLEPAPFVIPSYPPSFNPLCHLRFTPSKFSCFLPKLAVLPFVRRVAVVVRITRLVLSIDDIVNSHPSSLRSLRQPLMPTTLVERCSGHRFLPTERCTVGVWAPLLNHTVWTDKRSCWVLQPSLDKEVRLSTLEHL